jgi:hypothetical protein
MRNNFDNRGRATYFAELEPLAGAIGSLRPANTAGTLVDDRRAAAEAKRQAKAAKRIARERGMQK